MMLDFYIYKKRCSEDENVPQEKGPTDMQEEQSEVVEDGFPCVRDLF